MAAKRLKKATKARKTVGELQRRKRQLARARSAKWRAAMTPAEKEARKAVDMARCLDLDHLESLVEKDAETGCWLWQGPWRRVYDTVRPEVRRGTFGSMDAAKAMVLATRSGGIPANCSIGRVCGHVECIAPDHLCIENRALRRAKEWREHHGPQEGLRPRTGRDEPGDERPGR